MNGTIQLNSLDHYFAQFIKEQDSSPSDELWLAAALVSAVSGQGSICLDLAVYAGKEVVPFYPTAEIVRPPEVGIWMDVLSSCSTVGRPGEYKPLVLDDSGRLYLYRNWNYERNVAESLMAKASNVPVAMGNCTELLDRLFPPGVDSPDIQRAAAVAALSKCLTVISGGPGTGKTSTVARILALLIDQSGEHALQIALAAPTGKAASRLRQSIISAVSQLSLDENIRSRLPHDVKTIHRLLGVIPESAAFRHNRDNPLACDVLVVDEVSMVDLPLMSKLLDAVRPGCRVIMLGDQDQLASVEAGAVLADICHTDLNRPLPVLESAEDLLPCGTLAGAVVNLVKSYRFSGESGIGSFSRMVKAGDGDAAFELLASGKSPDLVWKPLPPPQSLESEFRTAVKKGYNQYMCAPTAESALDVLDLFRVLSPYREGLYGVENLNHLTMAALGLRKPEGHSACNRMAVMVTGNNYELDLFNGDMAVLTAEGSNRRLTACFPAAEGGVRKVSALRLPLFDPAFVLTVHKCQGSEFDNVLLLLPEMDTEILTRELIYTAVTRAKKVVEIWCSRELFCRAVERRVARSSGLRDRLLGSMFRKHF